MAGSRWHECGARIWLFHPPRKGGRAAFASMDSNQHLEITRCPQCGEELRETDLLRERPVLRSHKGKRDNA